MNWEAISAIAAITGAVGGSFTAVNIWIVRSIVRDEVQKINGTYIRSLGSNLTGAEIERRLEALEE